MELVRETPRLSSTATTAALAMPAFRHTPAVRLENACATGSAAIWAALDALQSGRMKRVLVVGIPDIADDDYFEA